ncbi:succinate dehydrogenase subunit C (cytochrome b-556) [Halodesulfurarchaeum formicicum]|uniref:Succinate dehydrogenase subunit C (Cytochrome b-556) n=1 Tax=Halodesulfurarchaeum formicicum TaxID=1873524 RepID=A0A1D8S379_9EURY|nr:succinate dehydrogenase, cytochrome b556 subunit [Halodesulfurarchaeum formicicum]AOW79809.1 succinate dehydrogenase subunit C (cytochrome b-556) [Halodesulfurarchaeum formicicum]
MSTPYDRGRIEDFGRFRQFSAGMWAWVLHKATGWVLIGYLFAHIAVLSTAIPAAGNPEAIAAEADLYTRTLQGLEGIFLVRVLEVGLLTAAVFHMVNGIRLLLVDLGIGLERQVQTFYASLVVTAVIVLASIPVFLPPEVVPW